MTTGFGFCSSCGTPRIAAEQRFCAGCGADLSVNVAPAPPAAAVELPAVETTPLAAPEPARPGACIRTHRAAGLVDAVRTRAGR